LLVYLKRLPEETAFLFLIQSGAGIATARHAEFISASPDKTYSFNVQSVSITPGNLFQFST